MNERQELWCHNCDNYVQFDVDMELNGNHVLNCPNCGHEHCRVVKDGIITDDRWDQRNGNTFVVTGNITATATSATYTIVSTGTTTGTSAMFYASAWLNTVSS